MWERGKAKDSIKEQQQKRGKKKGAIPFTPFVPAHSLKYILINACNSRMLGHLLVESHIVVSILMIKSYGL